MKFRKRWYLWASIFVLSALLLTFIPSFWFNWQGNSPVPLARATVSPVIVHAAKTPTPKPTLKSTPKPTPKATPTANIASNTFITRSGTSLLSNGHPFRFSGTNLYWLGLQETNGVSYPSHFNVDDALATASFMGATVVRSHTLGGSVGCSLCVEPTLGTFNPVALQHIDYAIASARSHHIRLIIPLVDNWHYYHGGKHTFTDWRGISDEQAFYSNPQVISDFEQYIRVLFNHVNEYTGIAYKDDPTILAWETGNELYAPVDWVQTIASYIKSIDHHHLLMDGNYEQADESSNFLLDLQIQAIDLYTGHYYPPVMTILQKEINQANQANKVFIIGEYDWNTSDGASLSDFLLTIEQSGAAGDMYWALFPHDDSHGFVPQGEHFTLHYPGDTSDMRLRVNLLCIHAYAMQGRPVPLTLTPGTPTITTVHNDQINWRGAFGAAKYTVERSTQGANGPWTVICDRCATDLNTPWVDKGKPAGPVWYRIKAYSVLEVPGPYSNMGHP